MTFDELAKKVADCFKSTMDEEGFETFDEMRRCYCWEAIDIKEEVDAIIREISADEYEAGNKQDIWMWDDLTHVVIGWDDMLWRDFKKLVFANLK